MRKRLLLVIFLVMFVKVMPVFAASGELTPESATIKVGETVKLKASVNFAPDEDLPKCVSETGFLSSSDTKIATVDKNGLVTGISAGEAIITYNPCDQVKVTSKIVVVGNDNPQTGSVVTIIALIVGGISLGLSIFLFGKTMK